MRGERVTWGAVGAFWRHSGAGQELLRRLPRLGRRLSAKDGLARNELTPGEAPLRIAGAKRSAVAQPALPLLGVAVCIAFGVRAAFFKIADWLWNFANVVDLNEMVPWAHWAMYDRDGAEAYGLLGAIAVQGLGTALVMAGLARLKPLWRAGATAALLALALYLAWDLPPRPPASDVFSTLSGTLWFVAGALLVSAWLGWVAHRTRALVPLSLALVLIPVCFVPIAYSSMADLTCLLAPALRLEHGIRLSQIYFQYDLLPSLLVLAWTTIGGAPIAFSSIVMPATFYALFLGIYALGRRFLRPELLAPLLISVVIVRYYSIPGDNVPQIAPLRLDLWLLPLALVRAVGLRHWSVGLVLGGLCFFSRSIGMLLVGAYGLALGLDFLAQRRASRRESVTPFWRGLVALFRSTAWVWGIILLSLLTARLVFGSFVSDAVVTYQRLGVGMMRIDRSSFYWWLLALTGAVGWLAYSRRGSLPARVGEGSIFAVTLTVSSSIYFFGRSHEINLLNTSVPYLFCLFLGVELAWPTGYQTARLRLLYRAFPWLVVATSAYFYSLRGVQRTTGQFAELSQQAPLLQATSGNPVPTLDCAEVRNAAGDDKVVFFSANDYWYYQRCELVPHGYFQPMQLALLKKPLAADLSRWLGRGFKLAVPRNGDFIAKTFAEFSPLLPALDHVDTPNFQIYRLRP